MAPVTSTISRLFARGVVPSEEQIADLKVSSLELDVRTPDSLSSLQSRGEPSLSPLEANKALTARDAAHTFVHGQGTVSASSFNNAGMLALFAIIGAGMVAASIWFFFFAKNGGFQFQQGDWEDYKSTVLRRKGPDGKTLSNATKSTKLGGGSVVNSQYVRQQRRIARTVIGHDEKGRKGILGKRGFARTHSIWSGDDYMTETFGTQTVTDMTEARTEYTGGGTGKHHSKRYRDRDVQEYKREKPARVGGINRVTDGSGTHFDHSTITGSDLAPSETNSEEPILKKQKRAAREHDDAERRARIEAAKMERRWKREAEEAAAALARENAPSAPRKSAAPSGARNQKNRRESRSGSPQKRDFSYQSGPASEILSTAYTATTATTQSGTRSASYYDEYRPNNTRSGYTSDHTPNTRRQSSPRKGAGARKGGGGGGYRRGADSDLE